MKLRLLRGEQREPREPLREEGTSKININISIVPLVPSVPSIFSRACEVRKNIGIHEILFHPGLPPLCKIEGTKGTGGTRALKISIFRFHLLKLEGTEREQKGNFFLAWRPPYE